MFVCVCKREKKMSSLRKKTILSTLFRIGCMPMFSHFFLSLTLHFIVCVTFFPFIFSPISKQWSTCALLLTIISHPIRIRVHKVIDMIIFWKKLNVQSITFTVGRTNLLENQQKKCGKYLLLWRQSQTLSIHSQFLRQFLMVWGRGRRTKTDMWWNMEDHEKLNTIKENHIETVGQKYKNFVRFQWKKCVCDHTLKCVSKTFQFDCTALGMPTQQISLNFLHKYIIIEWERKSCERK